MNNPLVEKSTNLTNFITQRCQEPDIYFTEIGVYNGENAKRVLTTLVKEKYKVNYVGFDLFEDARLVDLSKENPGINKSIKEKKSFITSMRTSTIYNKLTKLCNSCILIKGYTQHTLKLHTDKLKRSDIIYIDGGHSYKTVKNDWFWAKRNAKSGAILILDDISWEGVSRLLQELSTKYAYNFKKLDSWRKYVIV